MRLIDAEWLEKQAVCIYAYGGTRFVSVDTIKKAPTIEAEPVKHGRWKQEGNAVYMWRHNCSICGNPVYNKIAPYPYCPNCGCKMDLEG